MVCGAGNTMESGDGGNGRSVQKWCIRSMGENNPMTLSGVALTECMCRGTSNMWWTIGLRRRGLEHLQCATLFVGCTLLFDLGCHSKGQLEAGVPEQKKTVKGCCGTPLEIATPLSKLQRA